MVQESRIKKNHAPGFNAVAATEHFTMHRILFLISFVCISLGIDYHELDELIITWDDLLFYHHLACE